MPTSATQADLFRELHQSPSLLLLPNAWDEGSARIIENAGAVAVATTSAGVAWANGYPDGDQLPIEVVVATVAAIARVVRVPISADIEGGYSNDSAVVERNVARILEAGAVGINIEDGSNHPDLLCAKIESARRASERAGVRLFVNARTDVYLRGLVPDEQRVEETLARAQRYREAGADGLFVPLLLQSNEIKTVAASSGLPLNLMALPGAPTLEQAQSLGVKRFSAGASIAATIYGRAGDLAATFLARGTVEPAANEALTFAQLNGLMLR